jgi:hypothetical protein
MCQFKKKISNEKRKKLSVYIGINYTIYLIRTSFRILERCFSFLPLSSLLILSQIKVKLTFFYRPTMGERHIWFSEICTSNKNSKLVFLKISGPKIPSDKFKVI